MKPLEELKSAILDQVKRYPGTSFVELSRLDGFTGDRELYFNDDLATNLVLWRGVSEMAGPALSELMQEKQIVMKTTTPLVYFIDGALLRLPIAKRVRHYKKTRWLPVTFSSGGKP